jgi:hypothetical protein
MAGTDTMLIVASSGLVSIGLACLAALHAWNGWLELKRMEVERMREAGGLAPMARIDMADLRERVRKLEAIAAGIDC